MNSREIGLSPAETTLKQQIHGLKIDHHKLILENEDDRRDFFFVSYRFPPISRSKWVGENGIREITYLSENTPKQIRRVINQRQQQRRLATLNQNKVEEGKI